MIGSSIVRIANQLETVMPDVAKYEGSVCIPLPSDEAIRKVLGPSYDPDKTLNVLKMFAGTEDMCGAVLGLVKAIFQAQGIEPKTREMIILRAATVLKAPYEWQANEKMARNAGLSAIEIAAAASAGAVTGIHADYVLVCLATDELSGKGTLSDETLTSLLQRYGETVARKLVLMISWFNLLSLFLNGCRVPLETTDKIGNRTSPLAES